MTTAPTKILVVEDEAVILQTLQLILQQHGYEARVAHDAQEAFAIAPGFKPDILLCDIHLPDVDGIRVALRIKREVPFCRVVLLSGEITSAELLEQARAKGQYFEVLAKPTDPQQLLRVLAGENAASPNRRGIHRVK
ncbi:MAG TPA: response regulator [Terriglobales bacterium]|nr:response regulator [Terriglobales bacterium]